MDGFDDDEWDDFASSPMPTAAEPEGGGGEGDDDVFSDFQAPAAASVGSVGAAEPAELLPSGDVSVIDDTVHAEQIHGVDVVPAAGIPAVVPEELPAAVPAIEEIVGEPLSVRGDAEADEPADALLPEDRAAAHSEAAEPEAPVEAFAEAPAATVEEVSAEGLEDVFPGTGPLTVEGGDLTAVSAVAEAEDLVPSQDDEARQAVEVETTAAHVLNAAPEEVPVQHPVDVPVPVNTAAEVPAVAVDPFEGEDWDFTSSPSSAAAPVDLITAHVAVQQPAAVAADSVSPVLAAEAPLTASATHVEDLPVPIDTLSSAADPATAPVEAVQEGSADADVQFTAPAPSAVVPEPVAEMGAVTASSEDALQVEPEVLAAADIALEVVETTMAVETAGPDGEDWDVSASRVATEHSDQVEVRAVAVDAAALVLDAAPEEVKESPVPAADADDWDDFAAPAQPAESEASVPSPGANVVEPTEVDVLPADTGETGSSAPAPSHAQTVDSAEVDAASHELGVDASDEWDFAAAPAAEAVPVDVPVLVDSAAEMPAASAAVSAVDPYEGDDWDFSSSPSSSAAPVDLTAAPVVDQQSPAVATLCGVTVDPLRMLESDSASPVPLDATEVPAVADPSDADEWGGFAEPAPTAAVPEPAVQADADDWDDFAAPAAAEEVEAEARPSVAAPASAPEEVEESPVPAADADDWDDFAAPAQLAEPQAADQDDWDGFAAAPPAAFAAAVTVPVVSTEEAEEDWDAFTSSTEVAQEAVQAKVAVAQQDEDDWDAFTAADHTATVSAASALPGDLPEYSRWFIETVQGVVQNADTTMLLSLLAAQTQTDGLFLPSQEHHIPMAKLVNISFVSATSEEVPLSAVAAWTLQATEDILGQFVPEDLLSLEELEHHLGRHVQLPEVKEAQAAPPAPVAPPQASPQAPRASPQTSLPQRAPPSAQQTPVPPQAQPSPVVPAPSQTPTPSAVMAFLQSLPDLGYVLQVRQ